MPLLELGPALGGLGRPISLFSPILREPSLMLVVVDWNGSGAATLESFFSHLVQTMMWLTCNVSERDDVQAKPAVC